MDNKQVILIMLSVIIAGCIIAGAIVYSNTEANEEIVLVNNTTDSNISELTENVTVEDNYTEPVRLTESSHSSEPSTYEETLSD